MGQARQHGTQGLMAPLLLLLVFSTISPARAGGGSQLLIAITKTTSSTPADTYSLAAASGSLEHLSCSITEFQSDLQERLLSSPFSPSSNVETWSSKVLKMTWNDAAEVGGGKY